MAKARTLDDLLAPADQQRVVHAIARAERRTSGEIKVHVEDRCPGDAMARARALFQRLGLHRTRERNGVLVYIAAADHKFAILGDQGIHAATGDAFWHGAAGKMKVALTSGSLGDGLVAAIAAVGETLAQLFPARRHDDNQLSNEISVPGPSKP